MYFPQDMHKVTQDPVFKASRIVSIALLGTIVLYLVPADQVLHTPILGDVINWIANHIPSISRWVELSAFPESTKLFAVFIWIVIPIQTVLITTSKASRQAFVEKAGKDSLLKLIRDFLRVFVLLSCIFSLAVLFAIVDTPPCSVCVNSSKWALLFIGCIYAASISSLITLCTWYATLIFKPFAHQGKERV